MNWTGLAARLEKKYGLGEQPFASRKIYRHVERLCHVYGDPVYVIVQEMGQYADRRESPGRNFRAYVLKRIAEHGFSTEPGAASPSISPEEAAAVQKAGREVVAQMRSNVGQRREDVGF